MDKTEERYLIYGGAGLFLVVIAFTLLKGNGGNSGQPGTVPPPSPQLLSFLQHGIDTSTAAAQQKASTAAQSLLQYQNQKNQLELGLTSIKANTQVSLANAKSAEDIAKIQADAATQAATLGFSAAQVIANTQAQAAIKAAQAQQAGTEAQAHASQQNGFWSSISNIIGSIAKFL